MSDERTELAEMVSGLRSLLEAATEGPWSVATQNDAFGNTISEIHGLGLSRYLGAMNTTGGEDNDNNAALVVAARNALPALLDALAAATAERDRLKAALDLYKPPVDPDLWPILALVRLPHERRPMAIFRWPHETLREAVEAFARRWLPVRGYALAWVDPEAERLANEIAADSAADPDTTSQEGVPL